MVGIVIEMTLHVVNKMHMVGRVMVGSPQESGEQDQQGGVGWRGWHHRHMLHRVCSDAGRCRKTEVSRQVPFLVRTLIYISVWMPTDSQPSVQQSGSLPVGCNKLPSTEFR